MKSYMTSIGKDTLKGAALHRLSEGAMAYRAVAADVTAGYVDLQTDTTVAPAAVEAMVFSAVGTKRAWDGAVSIVTGNKVRVDNTGTTDFVAGDRIVVKAYFD